MLELSLFLLAGEPQAVPANNSPSLDVIQALAPESLERRRAAGPFFPESVEQFLARDFQPSDAVHQVARAGKTFVHGHGGGTVSFTLRGQRVDAATRKSPQAFATLFADDPGEGPGGLDRIVWALSSASALSRFAFVDTDARGTSTPAIASALRYEASFAAPLATSGIDIAFAPSGAVIRTHRTQVTSAGAEIRIGSGLIRGAGGRAEKRNFYLFAGAGGQALVVDVRGEGFRTSALQVEDRVVLGDMQAGLSFERRGLQFSLGLIRREYSYISPASTISRNENFGALSLTLRR